MTVVTVHGMGLAFKRDKSPGFGNVRAIEVK